ncbi:MAG TPA: DUF255 domain-containing protein, partial [Thermoanaerobaculia bacterium]
MRKTLILAWVVILAAVRAGTAEPAAARVAWRDWSDEAFRTARREHRLVLLDLGAVWCHWCHVMEDTT